MTVKEETIEGVYYYEIPGGMPQLKKHPYQVPLISHTKSLDEIMSFGDLQRQAGRKPCVILPCTSFPPPLGTAWDDKTDNSGIKDNIPAHLDCVAVDYVNTKTPALPKVWAWNKDDPPFLFWEYAPGLVRFRGTYSRFKSLFGFDPENDPIMSDPTPPGDPVIEEPLGEGCSGFLIRLAGLLK